MNHDTVWPIIEKSIQDHTRTNFQLQQQTSVGGGCISSAYLVSDQRDRYFVKLNRVDLLPMFETEASGLQAIIDTKTVKAPSPVCSGIAQNHAFLVLEALQLQSNTAVSERLLGEQLAHMHAIQQPFFGWHQDNWIGSTEQPNTDSDNWSEFWCQQRLQHQLKLAKHNGYNGRLQTQGAALCAQLEQFFSTHKPYPSLLHGDLWSGNHAMSKTGTPVIFDPACYFGDREADLAMTELFGGFSGNFYTAYDANFTRNTGYSSRKTLYNLYHILNHLNLFGGHYRSQAETMIDNLLSQLK